MHFKFTSSCIASEFAEYTDPGLKVCRGISISSRACAPPIQLYSKNVAHLTFYRSQQLISYLFFKLSPVLNGIGKFYFKPTQILSLYTLI